MCLEQITSIVPLEDRTTQDSFLIAGRMKYYHLNDRAELKAVFDRLQIDGVKNLYYLPGEHLFGDDGEGSVDGSHPTDSVSCARPKFFAQVLEPLLKTENKK